MRLLPKRYAKIHYLFFLTVVLGRNSLPDTSNCPDTFDNGPVPDLTIIQTDTLQPTDSIPLLTPENWRQTSGVQQLGHFIVITDLVLQDAYSIWADNLLTVIDRRSRMEGTINVQQLPGEVPGKGYYGALPLGDELLIGYSGAFARLETGKNSVDHYFPETLCATARCFPLAFLM